MIRGYSLLGSHHVIREIYLDMAMMLEQMQAVRDEASV